MQRCRRLSAAALTRSLARSLNLACEIAPSRLCGRRERSFCLLLCSFLIRCLLKLSRASLARPRQREVESRQSDEAEREREKWVPEDGCCCCCCMLLALPGPSRQRGRQVRARRSLRRSHTWPDCLGLRQPRLALHSPSPLFPPLFVLSLPSYLWRLQLDGGVG